MRQPASRIKQLHVIMIDSTCFNAHRTACSFACNAGELGRLIGKIRGGWNTKLHAICDGKGRIIDIYRLTGGNVSDYKDTEVLLEGLPERGVEHFSADMGYDANWIRNFLKSMGITPCIPGRDNRKKPTRYNKELYKERNKIEQAFGRIKDWRRVATRYDRLPRDVPIRLCSRSNRQVLVVILMNPSNHKRTRTRV